MTDQDKAAYRQQLGVAERLASKAGGHVDHVIWRDGHLASAYTLDKPEPAAPDRPAASRRGVAQESLL